jgi:holo-[acyl-carrier protein] synthase
MIVGVGIDLVDVERFTEALERTPTLAARLFTPTEREFPPRSLAARFACKEAVAKVLGAPRGLGWQDVEVLRLASGAPTLQVGGGVAAAAAALGVSAWHVSLSHDGGFATAIVIAES